MQCQRMSRVRWHCNGSPKGRECWSERWMVVRMYNSRWQCRVIALLWCSITMPHLGQQWTMSAAACGWLGLSRTEHGVPVFLEWVHIWCSCVIYYVCCGGDELVTSEALYLLFYLSKRLSPKSQSTICIHPILHEDSARTAAAAVAAIAALDWLMD